MPSLQPRCRPRFALMRDAVFAENPCPKRSASQGQRAGGRGPWACGPDKWARSSPAFRSREPRAEDCKSECGSSGQWRLIIHFGYNLCAGWRSIRTKQPRQQAQIERNASAGFGRHLSVDRATYQFHYETNPFACSFRKNGTVTSVEQSANTRVLLVETGWVGSSSTSAQTVCSCVRCLPVAIGHARRCRISGQPAASGALTLQRHCSIENRSTLWD